VMDAGVEFLSDREVRGYKKSSGDAGTPRTVFFYARFSKPFSKKGLYEKGEIREDRNVAIGPDARAYVGFDVEAGEKIEAAVALSFVNQEGARANFEHETRHFSFDRALKNAQHLWEKKLSKFEIEGLSESDEIIFYTAVYHSFISPNLISDVNGNYIIEEELYRNDTAHYSTFSTWDTYRALHPLFTIVDRESNSKFINSLSSRHHIQNVGLPIWEFLGHDNKCMISYNTVSPMVEAVLKEQEDIDAEAIYEAVTAAANNTDPAKSSVVYGKSGMEGYVNLHFVPAEYNSSVSKTTEQNYFDWCIAQLAKKLGKEEDYHYYLARSVGYKNLFHPEYRKLWPKYSNGIWREMDTTSWYDYEMNYVSGNIWGYSSYVPHDVKGLIELTGGPESFDLWLDRIFTDTARLSGNQHVDISGFIGKYGHGDEPSHHLAYLYNYAHKPWKTQQMVRRVMNEFYSDKPDGLVNNEDLGQMSAWYIFSAMGMYPVNPCGGYYDIGSPKLKKAVINLKNGRKFTVLAKNNSNKNVYIQSATLNGSPFERNYITHEEIMQGGVLEFTMGKKPDLNRGTKEEDIPSSSVNLSNPDRMARTLPAPYDSAGKFVFSDSILVDLSCGYPEADIFYSLDGSEPDESSLKYDSPVLLTEDANLKAIAMAEGFDPSLVMDQVYLKGKDLVSSNKKTQIKTVSPPDVRGDETGRNHFDGVLATSYHTDKNWSVWRNKNAEFILDFDEGQKVRKVIVTYLDHTGMNIFPPSAIKLFYSPNGENFLPLADRTYFEVRETLNPEISRVEIPVNSSEVNTIKILVEPFGNMPAWYKGSGQPANLYIGEIIIN
ncbi:MAG: GH92 family glycosyl hydrolase, partial [bacterium]